MGLAPGQDKRRGTHFLGYLVVLTSLVTLFSVGPSPVLSQGPAAVSVTSTDTQTYYTVGYATSTVNVTVYTINYMTKTQTVTNIAVQFITSTSFITRIQVIQPSAASAPPTYANTVYAAPSISNDSSSHTLDLGPAEGFASSLIILIVACCFLIIKRNKARPH